MNVKILDTFQDAALVLHLQDFAKENYKAVALYYFRSSAFKEKLTPLIVKEICSQGLYIVSVWENGTPTNGGYFTYLKGTVDGANAYQEAEYVGQPKGTPIYFAADYDPNDNDLDAIANYFLAARLQCLAHGYKVGAYGSGKLLAYLLSKHLVEYTWLAQSTGFAGYEDFKAQANIVQGPEHSAFGLDIDEDTSTGNGGGWKV